MVLLQPLVQLQFREVAGRFLRLLVPAIHVLDQSRCCSLVDMDRFLLPNCLLLSFSVLHALNNMLLMLARLSMLDRHILKVDQLRQDVPVLACTFLPKEHVFISGRNQRLKIKTS